MKIKKKHSAAVNLPKNNIKPYQVFTCYKKHGGSGLALRHTEH